MNIIVVGLGKVGEKLVERLSREEDHDITVIDTRQNALQEVVNSYDTMGVLGSGASVDVLSDAGIENTDI